MPYYNLPPPDEFYVEMWFQTHATGSSNDHSRCMLHLVQEVVAKTTQLQLPINDINTIQGHIEIGRDQGGGGGVYLPPTKYICKT